MSRRPVTRRGWRPRQALPALALALALGILAACQASSAPPTASVEESGVVFTLTSPAFGEGGPIPTIYGCDGEDISPSLAWTGTPDGTAVFALIVDDPDAGGFVHWVLVNYGYGETGLPEDAGGWRGGDTVEGRTDFGEIGYGGPCPPGGTHRYVFTLYALAEKLDVAQGVTADEVRAAMEGRVLAEAQLTGTYSR